jgi:uncharacterized protein (TIGR00290 family)
MAERAWMSWSSGKDSALALDRARHDPELDVVGMLCTVNAEADRVAMHAVRRELLLAQGDRLGLPIHVVELPWPCPNAQYEALMSAAVDAAGTDGVTRMIFGDLFLADIRAYREQMLAPTPISPVFPLWEEPTDRLAAEMIDAGIRAVLTCVDPEQISGEFAGRTFDAELLAALPPTADPCGENGEFHTFVWDSPGFSSPIAVALGDIVTRDGFVFADVIPSS